MALRALCSIILCNAIGVSFEALWSHERFVGSGQMPLAADRSHALNSLAVDADTVYVAMPETVPTCYQKTIDIMRRSFSRATRRVFRLPERSGQK